MNNFQYQDQVKRTLNTKLTKAEMLLNMALGLCGEAGEIADHIKKNQFQGHELDRNELIKEMGDVSWYLFNLMNCLEVHSNVVFTQNIDKLNKRYSKGFSEAESIKRVDTHKPCTDTLDDIACADCDNIEECFVTYDITI